MSAPANGDRGPRIYCEPHDGSRTWRRGRRPWTPQPRSPTRDLEEGSGLRVGSGGGCGSSSGRHSRTVAAHGWPRTTPIEDGSESPTAQKRATARPKLAPSAREPSGSWARRSRGWRAQISRNEVLPWDFWAHACDRTDRRGVSPPRPLSLSLSLDISLWRGARPLSAPRWWRTAGPRCSRTRGI